ncbi:MAG: DUF5691 domain-containing protein [Sporocytophaga sp.]|nr:DUF5691 domain-containing protein [Sporocytophaga sp.]
MEFRNNIINVALLGTSKKQLSSADLTEDFTTIFEHINSTTSDTEEKYLQLAGVAFNYHQCGTINRTTDQSPLKIAPIEEKSLCSHNSISSLKEVLNAENYSLLGLWLDHCQKAHQIVSHEIIPQLFSIAETQKNLREAIKNCCGKRGEWLSQFNPDWSFYKEITSEDDTWQTGTPEQRKLFLKNKRETDPEGGRAILQQSWNQESANTKTELLRFLSINISFEDEAWLKSLLNEKSQKVKDVVWELLKLIPESFIVNEYKSLLELNLILKKEKAIAGLISKIVIEIKPISSINELIYKSGIDKLSSSKEISDDEYFVYQLMAYTPPSYLETLFKLSPEEIVEALTKDSIGKKLLPAVISATGRFKDKGWALLLSHHTDKFYHELAFLLPADEQEKYLLRNIDQHPQEVITFSSNRNEEWSVALATGILKFTFSQYYQYNRSFYAKIIGLLPCSLLSQVNVLDTQVQSENMKEYILHLLAIKENILSSFKKLH